MKMREMKFRLFNKIDKVIILWDEAKKICKLSALEDNEDNKFFSSWMQYTGLKDKYGKEIYEGDVVDTVYDGKVFTGVVVYDESELDFKATNGKENYGSNFQYLPCCEEVEIIGNIYENPELLGASK